MSSMLSISETAKGILTASLLAIGLAACTASPEPSPGDLDPRLAGPCNRLTVAWSADASVLQTLIGANATQRSNDGVGSLKLSAMRCDRPGTSRSKAASLLYAIVTVPITADSVPLAITRVPTDGWWALPLIIADANTSALFARMGYEVLTADLSFELDRSAPKTAIKVQVNFPDGHIFAAANVIGNAVPHEASIALLENGADSWSAFFGQEQAQRYSSVSVTLDIEGDTPLSMFDLHEAPAVALFDEALVSDRILWRFPFIND